MIGSSKGTVDSRVVELSFQNQQFESGAKQSLSTLDRLKNALDFSKKSSVFTDIASGIKKVNLTALSSGVEAVSSKFSALDVIATRALVNITDSAMRMGKNFLESVSVDQVSAGWEKYAEKTSSVQTIMAATAQEFSDTGEQMEFVNGQLEKLNWFTDETSYSFLDMVNNIGKFTSNQIPLDQSVTAMQGISNWAAISGANINEAGRAMYNLSQAIATGSVKLIDWKSIENANMATAEFKRTAIETAESLGTLKKVSDDTWKTIDGKEEVSVKNFNAGLQKGWFTSEVLLKTLDNYGAFTDKLYETMEAIDYSVTTSELLDYIGEFKDGSIDWEEAADTIGVSVDDLKAKLGELGKEEFEFGMKAFKAAQEAKTFTEAIDSVKDAVSTGWMNTFEIIFGDYLQAKEVWTTLANDLYDIFAEGGNARNEMLKEAFDMGGAVSDTVWKEFEKAGLATEQFKKTLIEVGKEHGRITDDMGVTEKNFVASLKDGWLDFGILNEAWTKLTKTSEESSEQVVADLDKIRDAALRVIRGDFGNDMAKRFAMLEEEGFNAQQVQDYVNALHKAAGGTWNLTEAAYAAADAQVGGAIAVEKLSDEQKKELGVTDEMIENYKKTAEAAGNLGGILYDPKTGLFTAQTQMKTTGEIWIEALIGAMDDLVDICAIASEAWHNVFPPITAQNIRDFVLVIAAAEDAMRSFLDQPEKAVKVFQALFSILDIIRVTASGIATGAFEILKAVLGELGINVGDLVVSLSDVIIRFHDWYIQNQVITKAMSRLSDFIIGAIRQVRSWINTFMNLPIVTRNVERFKVGFSEAFQNSGRFVDGLKEKIEEFKQRVEELGGFKAKNLKGIFAAFKDTVLDYVVKFDGFDGLKNAFKGLGDDLAPIVENTVIGKIKEAYEKVKEFFEGTFVGEAIDKVEGAVKAISEAFEKAGQSEDTAKVQTFFESLSKSFRSFREDADSLNEDLNSEGWTEVFTTIRDALTKFFNFASKSDFSIFFKLAAALAPLLWVIKEINKAWKGRSTLGGSIQRFLDSISGGIGSIGGVIKEHQKSLKTAGIRNIAIAIGILVASIYVLAKKLKPEDVESAMGTIIEIGVLLGGIAMLSGMTGGLTAVNGIGFILTAVAIGLMVKVIKDLLGIEGVVGRAEVVVEDLMMLFAKISALMSIASGDISFGGIGYSGGKGMSASAGIGFVAIAGALWIMTQIVKDLALFPYDVSGALAVLKTITSLLAMLSLTMAVGQALGGGMTASAGVGFLMTAVAIKIILEIIKDLADADESIWKGIGIMVVLMAMLAGLHTLMAFGSKLGSGMGAGAGVGFLLTAIAIGILTKLVQSVSVMSWDEIKKGLTVVGGLIALLGLFSVLMGVGAKLGGGGAVLKAGTFLLIAIAVGILAVIIYKLSEIEDSGKLQTAALVVGGILALLAVLTGVAAFAKGSELTIALLAMLLVGVGLVLYLLSTMTDPESVLKIAESLAIVLLALSGTLAILAFVGTMAGAAIAGIGVLGILVAGFALFAALASMIPEETMDELLKGLDRLVQVGEKIGEFFGAIVGGFAEEAMSHLPEVADAIVDFAKKMKEIEDIDINGEAIVAALGSLMGASFTEAITSFFDTITTVFGAGEVDQTPMEKFADDMKNVGEGLKAFADATNGLEGVTINTTAISDLSDSIREIAFDQMIAAIEERVALLSGGQSSVESFANEVKTLGEGLRAYSDAMGELTEVPVDKEALDTLIEAIKNIKFNEMFQSIGAKLSEALTGKTTLDKFKEEVKKLADSLTEFSTTLGTGYNAEKVSSAVESLTSMVELGNAMSGLKLGGMFEESDFEKFKNGMKKLSEALVEFSSISIDPSAMSNISSASISITHAVTSLTGISLSGDMTNTGMVNKLKSNVEKLSEMLGSLGSVDVSGVERFKSSVQDIANTDLSGAMEALNNSAAQGLSAGKGELKSSGTELGDSVASGIKASSKDVQDSARSVTESALKQIGTFQNSFRSRGQEISNWIATGIRVAGGNISSSVNGVISSAQSSVSTSGFYSVGANLARALAKGINDNLSSVRSAVAEMGRLAEQAARAKLKINSPSKIFVAIGSGVVEGFVKGINDNVMDAERASAEMGDAVVNGAEGMAKTLHDLLSGDFDDEPVIRPVLDLSDIRSGAGQIGGILNSSPLGLSANFGAISENSSAYRNRATADDILSALSIVGDEISNNTGGDTYNLNGITYDDGSNVADAVRTLIHAAKVGRRV